MALKLKKVDTSKSLEAQWCDYGDGVQAQIMPLDNPQYAIALAREVRKQNKADSYFQGDQVGVLDGEKTEIETLRQLTARFLLLDWQGATDENDKPLAYNSVIGELMFAGDPDFFEFVRAESLRIAKENGEEASEIQGKPSSDSSGKKTQKATAKD